MAEWYDNPTIILVTTGQSWGRNPGSREFQRADGLVVWYSLSMGVIGGSIPPSSNFSLLFMHPSYFF